MTDKLDELTSKELKDKIFMLRQRIHELDREVILAGKDGEIEAYKYVVGNRCNGDF